MANYEFADEENRHLRISFLRKSMLRTRLYLIASLVTVGLVPLVVSWFRSLRLLTFRPTDSLADATHVLLTNPKTGKIAVKALHRRQVTLLPHTAARDRAYFHSKKHFYYFSREKPLVKSLKGKLLRHLQKDPAFFPKLAQGVDQATAHNLLRVYKENQIDIKVESVPSLVLKLLSSPFSMFQIFAIVIWYFDDYLSYALLILVMMVGSIATDVYEIRSEALKVRELAHHDVLVEVTRLVGSGQPEKLTPRVITRHKQASYGVDPENLSGSEEPMLEAGDREEVAVTPEKKAMSSVHLCVGDVVQVGSDELLPADILLIRGKCLVDESTLTGETVPVLKTAAENTGGFGEANLLSAGTKCLNAFNAEGVVVATGFYSKKGELVRSLLLADPIEFRFQQDALKFVMITIAVSTVGFLWFVVAVANGKYAEYYSLTKVIIKGLEIFTVAVPPALPLCLAIGNAIANRRLQRQQVFTRVLGKINEAGRVACACFDKTGTLTMNTLNLYGILPVYDGQSGDEIRESEREEEADEEGGRYLLFDQLLTDGLPSVYAKHKLTDSSYLRSIVETMGGCHSLALFHNRVIGDPMEEQLFASSGFTMSERLVNSLPGLSAQHLTVLTPSRDFIRSCDHDPDFEFLILRRIDFSSERKRMSVILGSNKDQFLTIITKGAPEVLKTLCDPTSLPFNFDEVLKEYTEQGLRVIAVARRRVDSLQEATTASSAALETRLEFLGFFLFQNPLKPNTAETIATLRACKINCKMITGDNILTATSVGIATGIVSKSAALFAAHAEDGELWWEHLENEDERREHHTSIFAHDQSGIFLSRKSSDSHIHVDSDTHDESEQGAQRKLIQAACDRNNCNIVMTGQAFDMLFVEGWEKDRFLNSVLEATAIFARTSPEQKAQIVEKIQKWYKNRSSDNWFVSFCGDGANDCSALKKADVGLSLSEAEASLAAPFNTTAPDISALLPLLREGKASLETAFMNFKYILYYSFVQFFALMAAYNHAQEFANGHYYFMDLIVFLPLSILICNNGTNPHLNRHFPKSSLMKREVLFEIFGHLAIAALLFVILDLLYARYPETLFPDQILPNRDIDAETQFNVGVFGFFIMATVLYAVGALVFNRGYPFKVSPWKNLSLVVFAVASLVSTVLILFAGLLLPNGRLLFFLDKVFRELRFDPGIILLIGFCSLFASLACYCFEKRVLPVFRAFVKRTERAAKRKKGKS